MFCPMMFNSPNNNWEDCECQGQGCARWSTYYGMCSDAVPAFLSGREEQRDFEEAARRGRRVPMNPGDWRKPC